MFKKAFTAVAIGLSLTVPALVIAQQQGGIALFTDNEPLTTTRLNQLVTAVSSIDFATPLFIEAVPGNVDGSASTRNFTAQSPGMLLLVPGGTGFQGVNLDITGSPNGGPDVIGRSRDGNAVTLPIGTGQTITLSFTNAANQAPNVNVYFTALTGGAPPVAN
jgi:hypothetical protein